MKQFNTCKSLLLAALLGGAGAVQAQVANTVQPLSFEYTPGTTTFYNYYRDYVGLRLQVTQPSGIAGDYAFTTTNDATFSGWGGIVDTMAIPIVDIPVYMPSGSGVGNDSSGCSNFTGTTATDMAGKIAVIWRGDCYFSDKATFAQNAGARAIVIINNVPGEGPVGMAPRSAAAGATVTIPVYMIGNTDGMKIAGTYRDAPPGTVKMTIVPWGKGLSHDVGFVPAGVSVWHNAAIPAKQLTASPLPSAYKAIDGAFIANYGTSTVNNVKLNTNLTFTPTGGSATSVSTSTLTVTPSASSTAFPSLDSIYAVFSNEYDLSGAGLGTQGRYDINYNITMDETDMAPGDNSFTHSFYATDSVYSKGRYDFAHRHPVATFWTGSSAAPYMWGVPYFVAKGGDYVRDIQFSCAISGFDLSSAPPMNFYIFKWTDGTGGTGSPDGAIEGAELDLVGTGVYNFTIGDSSFQFFNANVTSDTSLGAGLQLKLDDNSWYYIAAEITGPTNLSIGMDGIMSAFPRSFGREHFHGNTELYNPIFFGDKSTMRANPMVALSSYAFGDGSYDVDSVTFHTQKGLIPALAMRVKPFNVGVKEIAANNKVNLFPNPANEQINVSFDLAATAKQMSFTILNGAGQVVATEKMSNVQKDQVSFSTAKLPSGNYFMVITADGQQMHKKFTVIK